MENKKIGFEPNALPELDKIKAQFDPTGAVELDKVKLQPEAEPVDSLLVPAAKPARTFLARQKAQETKRVHDDFCKKLGKLADLLATQNSPYLPQAQALKSAAFALQLVLNNYEGAIGEDGKEANLVNFLKVYESREFQNFGKALGAVAALPADKGELKLLAHQMYPEDKAFALSLSSGLGGMGLQMLPRYGLLAKDLQGALSPAAQAASQSAVDKALGIGKDANVSAARTSLVKVDFAALKSDWPPEQKAIFDAIDNEMVLHKHIDPEHAQPTREFVADIRRAAQNAPGAAADKEQVVNDMIQHLASLLPEESKARRATLEHPSFWRRLLGW